MKQILVVDDEPRIAEIVAIISSARDSSVMTAGNGVDALTLARTKQPDLVVLDLGLPKMDGLDVTRALRQRSNVPIIMLTARVEESDKLIGLELGADDYLTKPFSPKELVARVRAVFRRTDMAPDAAKSSAPAGVTLDVPRMQAKVGRRHRRAHLHGVRAAGDDDASARPSVHARRSCSTRCAARKWNRSIA